MAVMTDTKTDQEIQRNVLEELKWDARVQPNEIGVAAKDGVVTLEGTVPDRQMKFLIEAIAADDSCVKDVENRIRVVR